MAQVAVIGLGRFGAHVARHAFLEGHQVLAVSNDPESVQEIKDSSHRAVVLDATDRDRLEALGLREFDVVVVSLGEKVDASAIIVLHLREMGVRRIIAKAGAREHGRLLELIGAHEVIYPEREVAQRLARRLRDRNLVDFVPLGINHGIEEIAVPSEWAGRGLSELELRSAHGVQVLAKVDGPTGNVTVNPDPAAPLRDSDRLLVLGTNADLKKLPAAR